MSQASLKINFIWAFAGNAFYALCGYLLLTILTKTSSVETVGLWGVGQAVTLPVATFFSLKLCTVNITDVHHEYQPGHYVALRLVASFISIVIAALVGLIFYPLATAAVIAIMGVSQSVTEIRSYFLSNMQKYEHLNLATLSQIFEGLLTLVLFGFLFWYTQNLLLAIAGTIISRLSILFLYDLPVSRKILSLRQEMNFSSYRPLWHWPAMWELGRKSAPLAVVAAVANAAVNIPRLVLDSQVGRQEVGYFTALSMLLVAYTMVYIALGNAALPRLSKHYSHNKKAFLRLLVQLIGLNLCLGSVFVGFIWIFGVPILTYLFKPEYAEHKDVMTMLAVSSCILAIFSVANWGLNAMRQFAIQVPIYIGTALISWISSVLLISRMGMIGGAYAFMLSYFFGAVLCLIFIGIALRKRVENAG